MNGKKEGTFYHLAYVFERFPSFIQMFCLREVLELEKQGLRPCIFSIHDIREEAEKYFPSELIDRVHYLLPEKQLVEQVKELKEENKLPQETVLTLRHWGEKSDKMRVYEAAYIGLKMRELGLRHVHTHFAGIGARVCWWIKHFYNSTYSFTGHANDLFCQNEFAITLEELIREASLVVSVSDYSVGKLKKQFPKMSSKIKRVYNGLDLKPFQQAAHKQERQIPPLILSVGRLVEKKGFSDLITACRFLKEKKIDFHCVIIGEGPLEKKLKQQIQEDGLERYIDLVGAKSQEEIIAFLQKAHVFALPCVTEKEGGRDNLPTVIMEAMAAKVPCVSTKLAGVPEMIVDKETGLLVEEKMPQEFAHALEKLLIDDVLREQMAERAALLVEQQFAQEVTTESLLKLLVGFGKVRFDFNLIIKEKKIIIGLSI